MRAIEKLDEGLWVLRLPHRMMGMELGTCSTLVRLASGGLAIISPGPFEEGDFENIEALGKVETLVAPNTFHHLFFLRAAERYPDAARFFAPGLAEKVGTLPAGEVLTDEAPALWRGALEQRRVRGTLTNEVVFFQPRSRTLILTDLAFNIRSGGFWTRLAMSLNGGFGRFGPTKMGRASIRDAAAFEDSLRAITAWDFERIVVAHGEVVAEGGHEIFCRAFGFAPSEARAGASL